MILDAYNANPSSMEVAISNFADMDHQPKLALIGHMLELGEESEQEHQKLINQLYDLKIKTILVGSNFENCEKKGFPYFEKSIQLVEHLKLNPVENHLVFIKGSRMVADGKGERSALSAQNRTRYHDLLDF